MSSCKARVSLCMIVRDEESNLEACLGPVAHLFHEIIVVDTGSSDATKTIARRFTPHVYDFAWCDDFAAARNESLRHATGDWIFWLDADDRMRPEQIERLAQLFNRQFDERPRAFLIDTVMQSAEAGRDEYVTSHARLFRRHEQLRWHGRVHEQLFPDPVELGYEWEFTDIQIDHIGYQDRVLTQRKARRKLRLLRMDYAVDPDRPSTLLHMGMALIAMGKTEEAKKPLLRLLELGDASQPYMRRVYRALAEIAIYNGRPQEAVQVAAVGLSKFPDDEQLMFVQASAFYALEAYDDTVRVLETLLQLPAACSLVISAVSNLRTRIAPRMLGAVRRMQGQYAQAETALGQVLQHFRDDVVAWYNLGLVYLDQQDGARVAAVIQELMKVKAGCVDAGSLAALWHLRHGDLSTAGRIVDDLVAEAPNLPGPRMLRAEWLSRSGASWDEQLRALKDLLRVQPGNIEARRWVQAVEEQQRLTLAAAAPVLPALAQMSAQPVA